MLELQANLAKNFVTYQYKVVHIIFKTYRSTQQNAKKTNSLN